MESGTGGASKKGVLVPVSASSDVFQKSILAPLKSAYLYEESKQCFRYKSAVFVKNPALEEKYNAFRAKRREAEYSEEDLEESYGFLLFDDVSKAHALGETGVLTGNSTCTTLGDPSQGVYISMYSDCLDLNRWYHGKSGYIAIIRLTKGRVKKVLENYTQNFTAPTGGFDCHVSEQLPSVSANTSSFLAFERTQFYIYELLDDGSNGTARSPSAACPFAIVSFSYADTKATLGAPHEKSEEKKQVCHYFPWRGQLQIGTQFYLVGLRSTAGALMPAELPPVVKVDQTISMSDLRQLLPRPVFDTCFSGEVFLDGLYCSLCELVSSEAKEASSLSQLLKEIKEKDVALTIILKDGGFLILLHSSHFLTYDDTGSSATEVLHGIFVFPDSRVIQKDTKFGQRKPGISSEILRVLPVLTYAEGEVEKTHTDPSEDLCDLLAHHMQSYAALINPGLALSPSREVSIFPDQYDVPDAYKHLYSSPEWTNRAWQSFRSYLSKPLSFQMSVSKVSEILAAGQEERIEDLDDDVYICLSSPEEAPVNDVNMDSEDQLTGQKYPVTAETSVCRDITIAGEQGDLPVLPQNVAPDDLQMVNGAEDTKKSGLTVLIKTDMDTKNLLSPSTSDDLPAELIVSITSAERTVTSVISTESATKHNDFQRCGFSSSKLQTAGMTSPDDDTVKTKTILDCPEVTNITKTKCRKLCKGRSKCWKKVSETPNVQTFKIPVEDENFKSEREDQAKESSVQTELSEPSKTDWRKARRRKRKFGKLSSKNKKVRCDTVGPAVAEGKRSHPEQHSCLMELESCSLRKKTERWDLKPVISECGKILVPHGSVDFDDQIKLLKDRHQFTKDEHCVEKMLVDASVNAHDPVKTGQESSTAPEMAVNEMKAARSKDEGNLLQTVVVRDLNPDCRNLRQSDDGSGSLTLNPESNNHSSKNDGADTPSSEADQEKNTDTVSPGKCSMKGEFLLSKLKSVLLRGKRKSGLPVPGKKMAVETTHEAEPCLKRGKVDSDTGMLKSNDGIASVQNTDVDISEVSKTLSVDPLFAYALGLTPKETLDKIQKTERQDTQQRKDSPETQEQTFLDKQSQIIQKPPSIFPRRGRIKTLKKHQSISAEHVKQKWWLHFQTPACFASEKLKFKECARDKSVRKTVKEKTNSACSSTDALNLLADLALANNDQVPRQPDPALEREPETSLKTCDLTNDVTNAEQQSVLHALLRQPATRPIQPLESPSPTHLVGGSELVALVSKEHAYSLPPSSSLLLGLSGTFQVSPLSGSTRLLHHHQTMYGNGFKTLQLSVGGEDRREHNHRTPEYLKKHRVRRRKFRHSRTFVNVDGSIQVTKQWKENYDFSLDSKFSSDLKDKAIIRALHGPWDFSIEDTTEDVRLIVHMWIGLFYSRSTARFFHIDPSLTNPSSEENDAFEMPSEMESAPVDYPVDPFPRVGDTSDQLISKALDLSKKDDSVLDQGSVILDLSLKNINAEISTSGPPLNREEISVSSVWKDDSETLNTLKSSAELPEASTSQCFKMGCSEEMTREMNDVKSTNENDTTCAPLQKGGHLVHNDVPSLKGHETTMSLQEQMKSGSVQPGNHLTASGVDHLLQASNNEKREMKDGMEKSETTNMVLVLKHRGESSKSLTDKVVEKEAGDVVHTLEQGEIESKGGKIWEVKEKPCQEANRELAPKVLYTGDDSTNNDSGVVCNGSLLEDKTHLSREKTKAVLPGKNENVDEDVDSCTGDDSDKLPGIVCNENLLENEIHSSREETKSVSPGKTENVDEDLNSCAVRENQMNKDDHLEKEDQIDERKSFVSAVEADSDLCDNNAAKKDCISKSNCQAPLEPEPRQGENEDDVCHDVQLRKLCANGSALTDDHAVSEKIESSSTSGIEPVYDDIWLADKAHKKTTSQNKVMANHNPSSDDHEEHKVDNATQNEPFHQRPLLPQCEAMKRCEAELVLNKETNLRSNKTNEGLEKIHCGVVIPFIGIDISAEDTLQPLDSHSQGNFKGGVEGHKEIPFISDSTCLETLPTETCSTSHVDSTKAELSAGKISLPLLDENETNQPDVLESESDDQCPTPTMDEKPFEFSTCSGPNSSSAFSDSDKVEMLHKPKLGHRSTVNSDSYPCLAPQPDLELRTLRVLQSIDKFLSKSSNTDESSQTETASMKCTPSKTNNLSIKYSPTCLASSHTSADFKDKKASKTITAEVTASTSQEVHLESSGHFLVSPFSKLEEVLGVKLQLKKKDSSVHQHYFEKADNEVSLEQDHYYPCSSFPPAECLKANKPNVDQDRHKTSSQTNLSNDPRSYSQRPVMAVRPSKSDEIQADSTSRDREIVNSLMPMYLKNNQTKTPVVTSTTSASKLLEKKTESLRGISDGPHYKQEASEPSSKSRWLPNISDGESNSDIAKFGLLDPVPPSWYDGVDISKLHKIPSTSFSVQDFESEKKSSKLADGNQNFFANSSFEKVRQTTKERTEMDHTNWSSSVVDNKDDSMIDDSLYLGPQSSLTCTVYNTSEKRPDSLMEQLSQRCIQDDLTQVSMERECLIFSEQMNQLLKRSKRGPNCQLDTHDTLNLSCSSPVTVHFSSLEEQEDSVDHSDAPSLIGQKIKVDMSDRKDLADTTEDQKTRHPHKLGNPIEHAGVSSVTAECASLYRAMMNDVCASKKVPKPKHLIMDIGYPRSELSNHFDFCDQMKKEMDESFRSSLNSVVKKSCKTKYRFYIVTTSEDAFFEETKAHLEAEGHNAVQPSEFFLGEDSASSLLIILRNEDIAEHICKVPHLLKLKNSPRVQFAGIDEPDDVVNLTHQELFMRGGFIMLDRAALESLSVCDMKKMTDILQELSRMGKWKWMLHYRDSRRLKETARLGAEAKEKKNFLNWCQEAGILEVLPYHECDLMSRDQPDYLTCLVRLQVQNISARYPVFITGTTTDSAFGKNGILTMTFSSFLTCSPNETFTV